MLVRYEQHEEMVEQWRTAKAAGRLGDREWSTTAMRVQRWLVSIRGDLELQGLALPPLPEDLQDALSHTTLPEPPSELEADS